MLLIDSQAHYIYKKHGQQSLLPDIRLYPKCTAN